MAQRKAKTKKEPNELVIARIYEQSNYRTRQDIGTWRNALVMAETVELPSRVQLYTLYDEILLDPHVQAVIQQRIENVLSQQFRIVNEKGEDVPDVQGIFEAEWFYEFLTLAMQSLFHGHSLIQLWDADTATGYNSIQLVPRRNVVPERGLVTIYQGIMDTGSLPYRESPYSDWVIEVGGTHDFGLLASAAPAFIIKKNAWLQWSQYCEIFGAPMRVGKTMTKNQTDINRMADNLKRMGSMAYGVFQEGETIEFLESTKGDAFNVYLKLLEYCDKQISKVIVGQTMTTDNGSSRSQGEVHERIANNITESDKRYMAFVVNRLLKKMVEHGFKLQGLRFEWNPAKNMQQMFDNAIKLLQYKNVPNNYFEEEFGIPVEDKPNNTDAPEKQPGNGKDNANLMQGVEEMGNIVNLHAQLHKLYNHTCEHHD